jgi:hypothetical protein
LIVLRTGRHPRFLTATGMWSAIRTCQLAIIAASVLGAPHAHGADALEVFQAATPQEQERMLDFAFDHPFGRTEFMSQSSTVAYIESLCEMRPGPTRDSEWKIAADEYRILERQSVADPVKTELLGAGLVDCAAPTKVVSGQLDITAVKRMARERERARSEVHIRFAMEQQPIEITAPTVNVDGEQPRPTECKPLPRDSRSMCDSVPGGVNGCESAPRTTCDRGPDNSMHGSLNDVVRGMDLNRPK